MGKLWRRSAGWRKAGWMMHGLKFRSPFDSEREKQKWSRQRLGHRNADVRGRQRALAFRRLVVVCIVLVRASRIRVVVCVNLMNQFAMLQQRVRRDGQPDGCQQHRNNVAEKFHAAEHSRMVKRPSLLIEFRTVLDKLAGLFSKLVGLKNILPIEILASLPRLLRLSIPMHLRRDFQAQAVQADEAGGVHPPQSCYARPPQ